MKKLNLKCYIEKILNRINKDIVIIEKLQNFLPRKPLIPIYKAIIRPHLDHEGILRDKPIKLLFVKKLNLFNTKQLLQLLVQCKVPPNNFFWKITS